MEEAGAPTIKRVGLKVTGRGIIREEQTIYVEERIRTGRPQRNRPHHFRHTLSVPGRTGRHGLIDREYAEVGNKLIVDVRGRMVEVEIVPLPFYTRAK